MRVIILLRLKRGFHDLTGTSASRKIVNNLGGDLYYQKDPLYAPRNNGIICCKNLFHFLKV